MGANRNWTSKLWARHWQCCSSKPWCSWCIGVFLAGKLDHFERSWIASVLFAVTLAVPARGDVVFYRLPTRSGTVVTLEGTTTVNPGGTVTFQHPRFGKVYFDLASVEIKKAPA